MVILFTWVLFFGIIWLLAFYRCSLKIFWLVLTLWLILVSASVFRSLLITTSVLWILWTLATAILCITPIRRLLLTRPMLHWFQRENPPLSLAEQQVLEAGNVGWEGQLFNGKPDWQSLLSAPKPALNNSEQVFLDTKVKAFCNLLNEWEISYQLHDLPSTAWDYIKEEGFWALGIDPKYGGHGFSPLAHSLIISKIATCSLSAAITVMVPNSLGPAEFITTYGTQAQKNYYLPRLAKGEEIPCFALTELEAGSDAASIRSSAVVCYGEYAGETVLGLRLNWQKRYITLAPIATLIGLAVHLFDPDHFLGAEEDRGITLVLVPTHLSGIEKGKRHFPLNMGFMNGPIQGKEVFVPLEQIIGGVERCGQGWQMMMECLALGRGISLPSVSTAIAQVCLRVSSAYVLVRHQFRRPISQFEGVRDVLAKICGFTYLCEATRWLTVCSIQQGSRPAVASAITKYHLTELTRNMVAGSMDIHAGRGIQLGPRNYLSFLYNMIPINITVEGANILTRSLIIFGQGLMRCHPFLKKELAAANTLNYSRFERVCGQHIGFSLSHWARLIVYGLSQGRVIQVSTGKKMRHHFRQLTRMSNAFAVLTDITLLILGKTLKIRESLSARLGDILSHLYMASAVLKFYEDRDQPIEENLFVEWCVAYCLYQIQEAILAFLRNFPNRWWANILHRLIFPWGPSYTGPADELGAKMAVSIQQNSTLRAHITPCCQFNPGSALWQLEEARKSFLQTSSLLQKIHPKHVNATQFSLPSDSYWIDLIRAAYENKEITLDEMDDLQKMVALCQEAMQVDEFEF